MRRFRYSSIVALFFATQWLIGSVQAADPFAEQVAPVLARRCLSCHNDQKSEGDLSLVDLHRLIDDGYVNVDDAAQSPLLDLIAPRQGRATMPKDSDPLSAAEVQSIRDWIEKGAIIPAEFRLEPAVVADRNWWSLLPLPTASGPLSKTEIDEWIDGALHQENLTPLPAADPTTLIRRVSYDLTGLPPTPDQIDAFIDDHRADPSSAWHSLVARLLESPQFGEKWGQHWLDIARYAETHGYDKDQPRRNAWPYRDYVINSFNADKPLGEFVIEQIAGDVLAADHQQGIVATGFLAAGPWDLIAHQEVGEDKFDGRIAKHLDRDEMLTAVFNVFQSTTIQCAQCHNHKFDPIKSEDYYRVHAVFAGVDRADRVYAGRTSEQQREKTQLDAERLTLVGKRDRLHGEIENETAALSTAIDPRIAALAKKSASSVPPAQHGFHSLIASRDDEVKWIEIDLGSPRSLTQIELIACFDDFNNIGAGFGFPVRFLVEATDAESFSGDHHRVLFDHRDRDHANPQSWPVVIESDESMIRRIRITANRLAARKDDYIFALGELRAIERDSGENVAIGASVTASDFIPPNARWAPEFLVDDRYYRLTLDRQESLELKSLREQRQRFYEAAMTVDRRHALDQTNDRIAAIDRALEKIPAGQFVYAVATDFSVQGKFRPTEGKLREIHFLPRGDLKSPGDRMLPGAPPLWPGAPSQFLDDFDHSESEARAALARSITHPDNPLLWRSMANRLWQWTFGNPLVATPNDFGRMGAKPTHPELLDRLAAALRDDPDQSIKSVVQTLVNTDAYRRASWNSATTTVYDQNAAIDSGNAFLWRSNRRRLSAEEFRDTVLAVSGTLRLGDRGGPSFSDFVIEHPQHSPHYEYDLHDPNDALSHRRTIYRLVVRSQPQPMLTTLDCADPSISVARRDESTTALQALAQWNSRLTEAMSKRFARRIANGSAATDDAVDQACRLAWGRKPMPAEQIPLVRLADEQGYETLCRVVLNASAMMYVD